MMMVGETAPATGTPELVDGTETRADPLAVGVGDGLALGVADGEDVRAGRSDSPAAMTTNERLKVCKTPAASL